MENMGSHRPLSKKEKRKQIIYDESDVHEVFDNTELNDIVDTENWVFKENNALFSFYSLYKARSG